MTKVFTPPDDAVQKSIQAAEASAKAVMEKLPLKFATRDLVQKAQADIEAQLLIAVERFLAAPLTNPETLRGRLAHFDTEGGRTYTMDGYPVLWVGAMAVTRAGDSLHGEHKFEHFDARPPGNTV